jgi:hypothetical protein
MNFIFVKETVSESAIILVSDQDSNLIQDLYNKILNREMVVRKEGKTHNSFSMYINEIPRLEEGIFLLKNEEISKNFLEFKKQNHITLT